MPVAALLLRSGNAYRRESFAAGLARHGYTISDKYSRHPRPEDLLVLWNRNRSNDAIALIYEKAGARVIIAENGYIGETDKAKPYALALGHHNGRGRWYIGDRPRFIPPERPWRRSGDHILVMPQRGIGPQGVAMPLSWPRHISVKLAAMTGRPIRMRRHPGASRPDPWPDLIDAHCVVTWGSGGAIKAIAHGVPVFHCLDGWIGEPASARLVDDLEICFTPDREQLWHRVSWAQWDLDDIQSGLAFEGLLRAGYSDLFCGLKSPVRAGSQ